LAGNAIFGFVLGFKVVDAALHYSALIRRPARFSFIPKGNWVGGIIVAGLMAYWAYYENKKQILAKPEQRRVTCTRTS
jgi:phosphatidylglycerol:prolipoprotein diacylglycerol transferase